MCGGGGERLGVKWGERCNNRMLPCRPLQPMALSLMLKTSLSGNCYQDLSTAVTFSVWMIQFQANLAACGSSSDPAFAVGARLQS